MNINIDNYSFDASAKTVTFSDYVSIRLDRVLLITNVTDNICIYDFGNSALGGTITDNVLTLTYNTTTMDDTDKLNIIYNDTDAQRKVSIINGKTIKSVAVNISSTGTVINAVTNKKLKIFAVKLVVSAAMSINFRDGATTLLEGPMPMTANSGYVESVTPPLFLFNTIAGNSLDLVMSGVGTVSGRISYWDDDII